MMEDSEVVDFAQLEFLGCRIVVYLELPENASGTLEFRRRRIRTHICIPMTYPSVNVRKYEKVLYYVTYLDVHMYGTYD